VELAAQEHVLRDVEVVGQGEVLVDELDAERRRIPRVVQRDRVALEAELAAVDGVDTRDALDEGRLARAVVADQRGHLAGIDVEVHVVEHVDGTEALVQLRDLQDRVSHGSPPSSRVLRVIVRPQPGTAGRLSLPAAPDVRR
jgi:hypothetical protein